MIYIGTSGFSYDDWKGHFYPSSIQKRDMLPHYARSFDCVEINSTYYAIPGAATFSSLVQKTPDDFQFVVKAHKDMTHVDEPQAETFNAFLGAIQPLRESGKLGCVLAQFPWGFKANPAAAQRLRDLKDRMGDVPTVLEFRNSGWVNHAVFKLLGELDFGFCSVDEPDLKGLMPRVAAATSSIGYVRFHGRNSKKWWKHDQAYERYDYLYSEDELEEWVPKVKDLDNQTEKTYLFFNNHYQGKSAQNARMFAKMLGMQLGFEDLPASGPQMTLGEDS